MMKLVKTTIALAVMAGITTAAFGQTYRSNARSGAKVKVVSHWLYNSSCHSASFSKVGFRQPANGKFSFVKTKVRVPKGKKCAGKLMNGVEVFYRSKAGFRGQDKGRAYFSFDGGRNHQTNTVNIIVNVK